MPDTTNSNHLTRRDAIKLAAAASAWLAATGGLTSWADENPPDDEAAVDAAKREIIRQSLMTREDVTAWLARTEFPFSRYEPALGYLHIDRDFAEGLDGAVCRYRYDKRNARQIIAHADQPCRINTYGNSFTSCEQVSDGETWQEVLASHLGEPIRNFGIGGYSVYQAMMRMVLEEVRSPADYVIFNIFDDDHYRNLHGWQRLRFGVNRKSANPPIPHLRVASDGTVTQRPNPCPSPDDLDRLCDFDRAWELFGDDYLLDVYARRKAARDRGESDVPASDFDDAALTEVALSATRWVIEKVDELAKLNGQQVLYVLSYNPRTVRRQLEGKPRFDASLVEYLKQRGTPWVDLLEAHAADYDACGGNVEAYIKRHFIGHYSPQGNLFCAFAMKDALVQLLDPKPPAYRTEG